MMPDRAIPKPFGPHGLAWPSVGPFIVEQLGYVPIIAANPRRQTELKSQRKREAPA